MSNELKAPAIADEGEKTAGPSAAEETPRPGETSRAEGQRASAGGDGSQKAEEYWDRLVRQTADFENYKKRSQREKQEAIRFANESLLEKLIPTLDSFDMAVAASGAKPAPPVDSLVTGINMVYNQLKSALAEAGLEEIDATNQKFDPNWHQAVAEQESLKVPEGQVLQQLRKGYKLRDRLLRPATVVVSKSPQA